MKFPLKLHNLKENQIYEREKGGYVKLTKDGFFFAKDDELNFQPATELNLDDGFEKSTITPKLTLVELFRQYDSNDDVEKKNRNFKKLLTEIVYKLDDLIKKNEESK